LTHRVVSLIPSATEIVCALGFGDRLVARSHECDYPPYVSRLPVCTEPKFDPDATSYQIDQRVKAILQEALSVYRVDAKLLNRVRPDVIVTQSQCEVCAVSLRDVELAVCQLIDSRPRIVSLAPDSLASIWADIRRVAEALEAPDRGRLLLGQMQRRIDHVRTVAAKASDQPKVACIEWIEPLMAAGNWMPELVEIAGGANLFGEAGRHSGWITFEDLQQMDPDVIFISPCGFGIPRTMAELPALTNQSGWNQLKSVNSGRVYVADGNQYFNRPGPRIADSAEILAEVMHPETFDFGYNGKGWIALSSK
jgi:iron complex transport system substrate-binding protein